jgi:hypothetical protein
MNIDKIIGYKLGELGLIVDSATSTHRGRENIGQKGDNGQGLIAD